jgi:hypothetical protein
MGSFFGSSGARAEVKVWECSCRRFWGRIPFAKVISRVEDTNSNEMVLIVLRLCGVLSFPFLWIFFPHCLLVFFALESVCLREGKNAELSSLIYFTIAVLCLGKKWLRYLSRSRLIDAYENSEA